MDLVFALKGLILLWPSISWLCPIPPYWNDTVFSVLIVCWRYEICIFPPPHGVTIYRVSEETFKLCWDFNRLWGFLILEFVLWYGHESGHGGQGVESGEIKWDICPHPTWLRHLSTWFSVGGAIWEVLVVQLRKYITRGRRWDYIASPYFEFVYYALFLGLKMYTLKLCEPVPCLPLIPLKLYENQNKLSSVSYCGHGALSQQQNRTNKEHPACSHSSLYWLD